MPPFWHLIQGKCAKQQDEQISQTNTTTAAAATAITEPKLSPPSRLIKLSGGNIHPGIHLGGNKPTLETATFSQRQTTDD